MTRIVFWMFFGVLIYSFLMNSSGEVKTSNDPSAGTTSSREYQDAWERSSEEYNRRYAYNEIPDDVRRILDTMPNSPGK